MITSWSTMVKKFRINPGAVCRQLLQNLKPHKQLTTSEEQSILRAIESSGVPNATERMLASMSRNTITKILENI